MGEKRKGLSVWVWVLIALPVSFIVPITVATVAVETMVHRVERTDAELGGALTAWSTGLVRCGEDNHGLPPSSSPVPATLRSISGKKYQSVAGDWSEPAHTCAGFTLSEPQAFQYTWLQRSPEEGVLKAVAADTDGKVDATLEVKLTCQGGRCSSNVAQLTDAVTAWQPEAALLGIEATLLDGEVQPLAGGTAKLSFGPSRFAASETQSSLFVVTYDKSGIASGPAKGTPGKAIAEPMCAPETCCQASPISRVRPTACTTPSAPTSDPPGSSPTRASQSWCALSIRRTVGSARRFSRANVDAAGQALQATERPAHIVLKQDSSATGAVDVARATRQIRPGASANLFDAAAKRVAEPKLEAEAQVPLRRPFERQAQP